MVRHGETEYNSSKRLGGSVDIGLNPLGLAQIERLRARLAGEKIDAVCASTLQRAQDSAKLILNGRGINVRICPELSELNYGDAESLTFSELKERFPDVAKAIINRDCDLCFPNGEGFKDLEKRIRSFMKQLEQYHPDQTVLIVSHSGPLILLVCLLLGMGVDGWWHWRMDNAGLSVIDTYPEGAVMSLFNDVSHLDGLKPKA